MPKEVTDKDFEQEVLKSSETILVDFWAPWCGPCKMMGPIVDKIENEYAGKIKVMKMNVDESPQTAQKYQIMSIPTLKIFKNGQPVSEIIGLQTEEQIKKEIDEA